MSIILKTKDSTYLQKPTFKKIPIDSNYFRFTEAVDDRFLGSINFLWLKIRRQKKIIYDLFEENGDECSV